jgi:signal transduction histidine kinase
VFEIFFYKYYQILLCFFGAIFFYEAMMNIFHYFYHKQKDAFNHVFMCLSNFFYCLILFIAVDNEFTINAGTFTALTGVFGGFACFFYFGAVKSFLKIESKILKVAEGITLGIAVISIMDFFLFKSGNSMILFVEGQNVGKSAISQHLSSTWSLSPFALGVVGIGQVISFLTYVDIWKFIQANKLKEPLLGLGLIMSFLATLNDVMSAANLFIYSIPIVFLGFFFETIRFSSFYSKVSSKQVAALQLNLSETQRVAQVGTMSASIAHDVRNPLTLILMSARIIQKIIKTSIHPERQSEDIQKIDYRTNKIITAGDQIESVIKTYLLMMRKQANEPKEEVLLYDLLGQCEVLFSPRLSEFKIDFRINIAKDIFFKCRESDYLLIFSNLLANSIDAVKNHPDKWIEVSIKEINSKTKIFVTDSGPEIPMETRDKMFTTQFTTKKKGEGTGLGLGIISELVKGHGHHISLNTENKNTQFIIEL